MTARKKPKSGSQSLSTVTPRPARAGSTVREPDLQTNLKKAKNLLLPLSAITAGEAYSRKTGTSLSQLVANLLLSLPSDDERSDRLSPAVERLYGVASVGGKTTSDEPREAYKAHLSRKFGVR